MFILSPSGPSRLTALAAASTQRLLCGIPSSLVCPATRHRFSTSTLRSSGHNRWSKIRHKKGAADAAKSALFSRLTNEIHQALRPPNSWDPSINNRLSAAIAKAREGGVPKINIENCFARAKALAEGSGQTVTYEAVGPGGIEALIIECLTDNPARTARRVKEILHKNSCRISPVGYLFEKKGLIAVSSTGAKGFDDLFEFALDGGATDVKEVEGDEGKIYEISTPSTQLAQLADSLGSPPHNRYYRLESSEIAFVPMDPLASLSEVDESGGVNEQRAEAIAKVVDLLEAEPEVVRVWTNLAD